MKTLNANGMILEPLTAAHTDEVFPILRDIRIYEFIPDEPPESLELLRDRYIFLESAKSPDGKEYWLNWIVYLIGPHKPIGTVQATVRPGKSADIAFIIVPDCWNQKFGRLATAAMLDYIFEEFELNSAVANVDTRNSRSQRMVEALGFDRVRKIEDADFFKGSSSDEYEYEIQAAKWKTARNK